MSAQQSAPEIKKPLERRFEKLARPFDRFIRHQISGALLLLLATAAALLLANSGLQGYYHALESVETGIFIADFELRKTLHHWVNDAWMVLFFFLLGLEIKREFIAGELRSFSQSSTVIMAAAGGMLFPAIIYLAFNFNSETARGWGIPMATDAAFALGALALLGSRIPSALKVFLVALAIVDDIGAIIVIALFYTENLQPAMLGAAVVVFAGLLLMNRLGIRHELPYFLASVLLWFAVLQSGVHATIAGVLAALAIPARPYQHPHHTAEKLHQAAGEIKEIDRQNPEQEVLEDAEKHAVLEKVEQHARKTTTPLRYWENTLEHPVALFVVPMFAFLNAGIVLSADTFSNMQSSNVAWGIIAGLMLGKPLGIVTMAWLNVKLGWGTLPDKVSLAHLFGIGLLAGMGFTMSIFIATLSFANEAMLTQAKASIMLATLLSGLSGILCLWLLAIRKRGLYCGR